MIFFTSEILFSLKWSAIVEGFKFGGFQVWRGLKWRV